MSFTLAINPSAAHLPSPSCWTLTLTLIFHTAPPWLTGAGGGWASVITESQMVWVGKDLKRSSCSSALPWAGVPMCGKAHGENRQG